MDLYLFIFSRIVISHVNFAKKRLHFYITFMYITNIYEIGLYIMGFHVFKLGIRHIYSAVNLQRSDGNTLILPLLFGGSLPGVHHALLYTFLSYLLATQHVWSGDSPHIYRPRVPALTITLMGWLVRTQGG